MARKIGLVVGGLAAGALAGYQTW